MDTVILVPTDWSPRRPVWQDRAACAEIDPELWFPEKGPGSPARHICRSCDVRAECLEYALDHDEQWGIWGGLSLRERLVVKRQRRMAAA